MLDIKSEKFVNAISCIYKATMKRKLNLSNEEGP